MVKGAEGMRVDLTVNPDGSREEVAHNGDGTGTRTVFDADGNVESVEQLTDLPIPEPMLPERLPAIEALLTKLSDAQSLEEVRQAAAEAQGAIG